MRANAIPGNDSRQPDRRVQVTHWLTASGVDELGILDQGSRSRKEE